MKKLINYFKKYKELLLLFSYLILITSIFYYNTRSNPITFFMGAFFISFSFFKIITLKEFESSFKNYDLISKLVGPYAKIYTFIEILLGILFLTNKYLFIANFLTVIVLSSTLFGIIQKLRKGKIVECACLGKIFKIPLSTLTVLENTIMISLALINLIILF